MAQFSLWCGKVPLDALGPVGDLAYQTAWGPGGGGLSQVSWSMAVPQRFSHPALRIGAPIILKYGGLPLGQAVLQQPDYSNWSFTAYGLSQRAKRFYAVDGTGAPTNVVSAAFAAQAANLRMRTPVALPSDPVTTVDPTSGPVWMSDLLDAYCAAANKRWWVDAGAGLFLTQDPATPRWSLTPGTPSMESADDDFATTLRVKYVSSQTTTTDADGNTTTTDITSWTSATNQRAADQWDAVEATQDLTSGGIMSTAAAQAAAAEILAADSPRPAFTSSIQVGAGTLANMGGVSATDAFWLVRAGQMVRHHDFRNLSGSLAPGSYEDWVIGATSWSKSQGLVISPLGLAARTVDAIIARLTAAAAAA